MDRSKISWLVEPSIDNEIIASELYALYPFSAKNKTKEGTLRQTGQVKFTVVSQYLFLHRDSLIYTIFV